MAVAQTLTAGFWLAVFALVVGVLCRVRIWSRGRRVPVDWVSLFAIPKRYLVDVHRVVALDPYIARTHVAVAGGAVALILGIALNYGFAIYARELDVLIAVAAFVMLAGAVFVWLRRVQPIPRLSRGAWMRVPHTLAAFAAGWLLITMAPVGSFAAAVSAFALLLILLGAAELVLGTGLGAPMKHAVAGMLHLAFHPRPERFDGRISTALLPLDLEEKTLGSGRPADFTWKQLLSFDACVQCGKCEAACPAFAAEQPLNPKKLIQDLVAGMAGGSDTAYAGRGHPGQARRVHSGAPLRAIVPELIEADTLWSCTTCRACVQECPMLIEHVDAIVGLRRYETLHRGDVPLQAAQALERLRETETLGGYPASARYTWATDLAIRVARPGETVECLLIAGEGAYDLRYQRTLRALVKTLKAAGLDFAVLGDLERDCGDVARRLGDEDTFVRLARRNIEVLNSLTFRRIVTPDPHVLHALRNEYPALGGRYEVVHHTALLDELMRSGRLRIKSSEPSQRITYHDPCYLARYNGEVEVPRAVLRGIGIKVEEMARSGMRGRCCGGGGGAALSDIPGKRRIPDIRIDDARATHAEVVAVACPNCTAMLEGVAGPRPEVKDVVELVSEALEA